MLKPLQIKGFEAEREGFEPSVRGHRTTDFESANAFAQFFSDNGFRCRQVALPSAYLD